MGRAIGPFPVRGGAEVCVRIDQDLFAHSHPRGVDVVVHVVVMLVVVALATFDGIGALRVLMGWSVPVAHRGLSRGQAREQRIVQVFAPPAIESTRPPACGEQAFQVPARTQQAFRQVQLACAFKHHILH